MCNMIQRRIPAYWTRMSYNNHKKIDYVQNSLQAVRNVRSRHDLSAHCKLLKCEKWIDDSESTG